MIGLVSEFCGSYARKLRKLRKLCAEEKPTVWSVPSGSDKYMHQSLDYKKLFNCVYLCVCVCVCVCVCFCVSVCVCVTVHEAWSCRRHFSCVSGFPITSSRFNPATSALSKDCGSENFSYLHIPPVARCNMTGWPPMIHSHLTLTLCSPLQPERRTPGPEHIQVAIHQVTSKSKEA